MKVHLKSASPIRICLFLSLVGILAFVGFNINNRDTSVNAVSAMDFNAGDIISDYVFYNKDAMSVQQIQDFLNKLIPNCNTWNPVNFVDGSGTTVGPPYVCINNYHENPTTGETSFEKGGGAFEGGISAAQIIYNAAQEYGVNPQVLLVMLKKESLGPLTSDNWPTKYQYRYAMGYACPDSGPGYIASCNDSKAGFYKQVMLAAWQLNYYKEHPNDYRYHIGWNDIQYSPDPTCGTKQVYIENIATLSLYIYTPYTPNNAALANYPGTASCGAYGNRNFFMFFSEWFGNTHYEQVKDEKNAIWRLYNRTTGGHFFSSDYKEVNIYLAHGGWINDGVVSHYSDSGTIPIHRLYNPQTKYHILSGENEASILKRQGWIDDGVIFKGTSSGKPVWRLNKNGHFFITNNTSEMSVYQKDGWSLDGVVYFEISEYERPVWRLYNKSSGSHILVSSAGELTNYLRVGWINDGVIMSNDEADSTPVYRLWNGRSHFFTASESEKEVYLKSGWTSDGVIFYTSNDPSGTPVYRLWNGRSHFFTASESEKEVYLKSGWTSDGVIFYTNNILVAHRLYNGSTGAHRISVSSSDINNYLNQGWIDDGGIFKVSSKSGIPVYELYNSSTKSYFYTSDSNEVSIYQGVNWSLNGIKFYAKSSGASVYRLYNSNSRTHILIKSENERNIYINAGWINDGIVFSSY